MKVLTTIFFITLINHAIGQTLWKDIITPSEITSKSTSLITSGLDSIEEITWFKFAAFTIGLEYKRNDSTFVRLLDTRTEGLTDYSVTEKANMPFEILKKLIALKRDTSTLTRFYKSENQEIIFEFTVQDKLKLLTITEK